MKKITYICDRCKREIAENPIIVAMESVDRDTDEIKYDNPFPELNGLHFCKDCAGFFAKTMGHRTPAVINQEFEDIVQDMIATSQSECGTNPPPADKPKRRLDGGKIRALRNAGWTVKAIAEEMNCSEQAVYNVLKKLDAPADKKKAPEPEPAEQSNTN